MDGLIERIEKLKYQVQCEEHQVLARHSKDVTYLEYLKKELGWLEELQNIRSKCGKCMYGSIKN